MAPRPLLLALLTLACCAAGPARADGEGHGLLAQAATGASPLQRLILSPRQVSPAAYRGADSRTPDFPQLEIGPGLGLLCDAGYGITAAFADLDQHCLLARLDEGRWSLGQVDALSLRSVATLELGKTPLDLHLGLSWLQGRPERPGTFAFHGLSPLAPGVPDEVAAVRGLGIEAGATYWAHDRSWIRVIGRHSRFETQGWNQGPPLLWNAQSLSLDAGLGAFSGNLTGRRTRIPSLDRSWVDLDIGVTWRTPWSASLTVGARNLLAPAEALHPDLRPAEDKATEARTPYVRYEQDL